MASPPGDDAAWFWSFDCAQNCDHLIPGGDFVFAYVPRTPASRPYSIGIGLNGVYPYAEGYGANAKGTVKLGILDKGGESHSHILER